MATYPLRPQATWIDTLQTLQDYVLAHLEKLAPKELVEQKRIRARFQQRGYAGVLSELLSSDPLMALFAYVRMSLHIEYAMQHKVFWIIRPDPEYGIPGVVFPDDWTFPEDPWKKEWWMERPG